MVCHEGFSARPLNASGKRLIQSTQRLVHVIGAHRRAEAVMARRPAVIVEVNAVCYGRLDEAQHLLALMMDGIAVIAHFTLDAEIDAEASTEPLNVSGDP